MGDVAFSLVSDDALVTKYDNFLEKIQECQSISQLWFALSNAFDEVLEKCLIESGVYDLGYNDLSEFFEATLFKEAFQRQ